MAPLVQWAIQILLGSTRTKDLFSSIGTESQITHHTNDELETPKAKSSAGVTAVSSGTNRIDAYAGPFQDGSLGHKYFDGSGWFPSDNYEIIGGSLKGPPLAISWGPNRNDVFAVGQDNQLWHKALDGSTWSPSLSGWENLGGNLSFSHPLAAVSRIANRLDVFGVRVEDDGSKSLWRKSWNGTSWAPSALGFEHIAGKFLTAPSVASRLPHGFSVYIVDLQGNLLHRWWDSNTETWEKWVTIGTQFRSPPAAVSINSNRDDVLCIGADGVLYDVAWVHGESWKEKQDIGGRAPPGSIGFVSVQKQGDGMISVFAVRFDGQGQHKLWSGEWGSWAWHAGWFDSLPAQASWGSERLDVFGLDSYGRLNHQSYQPETGWNPGEYEWEDLTRPWR